MVESELASLEVDDEAVGVGAVEVGESGLGVAPEPLHAVDVVACALAAAKLFACVVDAQMVLIAHVD